MNKKNFVSIFVLAAILPMTLVSARETISSFIGDEDLFFNDEVFIEGTQLPDNINADSGTSTVTLEGAGSLTLADRKSGARISLFGGTTISSNRSWEMSYMKTWWNGLFTSLKNTPKPQYNEVSFNDAGQHAGNRLMVEKALAMGISNESFSFSQPAMVVVPSYKTSGTRLWIAKKEVGSSIWNISEDSFCIVENGFCVFGASEITAFALVQELYSKCPVEVIPRLENGEYIKEPDCLIKCYPGYVVNENMTDCIKAEENNVTAMLGGSGSVYKVRPGTFRLLESRAQFNRYQDQEVAEGLSYKDKQRVLRQGAASHETVRDEVNRIVEAKKTLSEDGELSAFEGDDLPKEDNSGFLNYILEIKNSFKDSSNVYPAREDLVRNAEGEWVDEEGNIVLEEDLLAAEARAEEESMHSSAPLLPSTGSGIFLSFILIGIAFMVFARRKQI